MSQPPNSKSSILARGTKSLILGVLLSVRLPRRIVFSWVMEPIGFAIPSLMASIPAMNVVVTAPIPGIKMPSFPSAGWMVGVGFDVLSGDKLSAVDDKRFNSFGPPESDRRGCGNCLKVMD